MISTMQYNYARIGVLFIKVLHKIYEEYKNKMEFPFIMNINFKFSLGYLGLISPKLVYSKYNNDSKQL